MTERAGKPIAKLVSTEAPPQRVIGQDDGLFEVPDDFDSPLDPTSLKDILGCMSYQSPAKTLEEMEAGIAEGARAAQPGPKGRQN